MNRARKTLEQRISKLFVDLYVLEQRAKAIERELSGGSLQGVSTQMRQSVQESATRAGILLTDLRAIERARRRVAVQPNPLAIVPAYDDKSPRHGPPEYSR